MMPGTVDDKARRIAEKGREALVGRLREAFEEAAAAHADVLELDEHKLEEMVERAADRADGLQWRRALASVATDELGIGLGEALGHPAVAEAHRIVGAPSYEDGLAAIAEGKTPEQGTGVRQDDRAGAAGGARGAAGTAGAEVPERDGPAAEPEDIDIRIVAVHLDGPPELEGEEEVALVFSGEGLEVVRGLSGSPLVRYAWSELRRIELARSRRSVLRRRPAYPRVTVGTAGGEARFEVEGVDAEWLEQRLAPAVARLAANR
jgi:hypothetical protein